MIKKWVICSFKGVITPWYLVEVLYMYIVYEYIIITYNGLFFIAVFFEFIYKLTVFKFYMLTNSNMRKN